MMALASVAAGVLPSVCQRPVASTFSTICLQLRGSSASASTMAARFRRLLRSFLAPVASRSPVSRADSPVAFAAALRRFFDLVADVAMARSLAVWPLPAQISKTGSRHAETIRFLYDAFGRTVLRDVPALSVVDRTSTAETYTVHLEGDVSADVIPLPPGGDGCSQCRILIDANTKIGTRGLASLIRSAANQFKRVTVEPTSGGTRVDVSDNILVLSDVHNVTLRNLNLYAIRLTDCRAISLDGCTIAAETAPPVVAEGACPGLQVQNCTLRAQGPCVHLNGIRDTSALFAFNLLEGQCSDDQPVFVFRGITDIPRPGKPGETLTVHETWLNVAIINNIFADVEDPDCLYRIAMNDPGKEIDEQRGRLKFQYAESNNLYRMTDNRPAGAARAGHASVQVDSSTSLDQLRSGSVGVRAGTADTPACVSGHELAIWDADGTLRDPKYPTIGPKETLPERAAETIAHRYVYDASRPTMRETYRYSRSGQAHDLSRVESTRFVPGGGIAPTFYADSDGRVDVAMPDAVGQPLATYRAREGRSDAGQSEATATAEDRLRAVRGCGVLRPPSLPVHGFMDFPSWSQMVLEPDVLMGRRGLAGWDRFSMDRGLMLTPDVEPSWWQKVCRWWDSDSANWLKYTIMVMYPFGAAMLGLYSSPPGVHLPEWASFTIGFIETAVTTAAIIAAAIVLVPLCPVAITLLVGGAMLAGGFAMAAYGRARQGQSLGQVLGGAALDTLGVSDLVAGATGNDVVTGRDLGLSSAQRGRALGRGLVTTAAIVGLTAYGAVRSARLPMLRTRTAAAKSYGARSANLSITHNSVGLNSPWGQLRARVRELGTDPVRGFIRREGIGGVRIERVLGRAIRRSEDVAADFVDDILGPLSLKGPIPLRGDVEGLIKSSIKDAFTNTATRALFVDLRRIPAAQQASIMASIRGRAAAASKTIFFLE